MLDLLVYTVALFQGTKDERTVFSTAAAPVSEALNEKAGARSHLRCELATYMRSCGRRPRLAVVTSELCDVLSSRFQRSQP